MWKLGACHKAWLVEPLTASDSSLIPPPELKRTGVSSRFAAWCRRYSIDELPQLWNVVRGEMGLVGPRPITRSELDRYYGSAAWRVLSVKPGVSGLWQVRGRSRLSYRQRRRLDLFLVMHWSVPLYLKILALTIPKVLTGKDAW
jgi:lipopolysaccharide/colanic/teichoic acid biosynthesis glycosyltransferase